MEPKSFFQRVRSFLTAEGEGDLRTPGKMAGKKDRGRQSELSPRESPAPYHIEIVEPKSMDMANDIADKMISESALILNLQSLSDTEAKEMLYFLSGVSHAMGGTMEKISSMSIFLYKPRHLQGRSQEVIDVPDTLKAASQ